MEVRIIHTAPVRGYKIDSGVLCGTFATNRKRILHKYFLTCPKSQISVASASTTYTVTFQAIGFKSLRIKGVQLNQKM